MTLTRFQPSKAVYETRFPPMQWSDDTVQSILGQTLEIFIKGVAAKMAILIPLK